MKSLLFKSSLIVCACFLLVIILSFFVFNESFYPLFDYTEDDKVKISTTINALATPVISLISVVLLYITLTKQIESNYFQKKAKNLDLILVMYNQLQVEYENFSYTISGKSTTNGVSYSTGEAMLSLFRQYKSIWNPATLNGKPIKSNFSIPIRLDLRADH